MVLMFLKSQDFNIKKNRVQLDCRDNIVLVFFKSKNCDTCKNAKVIYDTLPENFPDITFAICNVDNDDKILEILKLLDITAVPSYALFKIGVFERLIGLIIPDKFELELAVRNELKEPYVIRSNNYLKLYEI